MNSSAADDLIEALSKLRRLFPDWRMGQMVSNLVMAAGGTDASAIWDIEDDRLLAAARRLIARNVGREAMCAEPMSAVDCSAVVASPGSTILQRPGEVS